MKDLLSFSQGNSELLKLKKIVDAFTKNNSNNELDLDVEEQFYEQVRIAQKFKELNRKVK